MTVPGVPDDFPTVPFVEMLLEVIPRLSWTSDELDAHRRSALTETLRAAYDASAWHRDRLDGIDFGEITPDGRSRSRSLDGAAFPASALIITILGGLALVNVIAAFPARAAAHTRPAVALRTE